MPRPISYAVFCLKKKIHRPACSQGAVYSLNCPIVRPQRCRCSFFFDGAVARLIYALSLHDALPICAGADASSAGMVDAGFENQKELTKMQLDNQKEIAEMQNETQKEIAGIQSATSRQNTKDQVYAQNEMLAYQQKESTARVASI